MLVNVELTEQQRKALALLANGKRVKDLMLVFSLSKPASYHLLRDVRNKLGAETNTHAVAIAISNEIIDI